MDLSGNSDSQIPTIDWQAIDAEQRVNLIRISAIAGFYLIHLWHVASPVLGAATASVLGFEAGNAVPANVHLSVTLLCLGWLMQSFAVHLMIAQRRVSNGLVTAVTLGDLGWLTAILCLSSGPAGPMVAGYFLIIILTGLRFDLRLVRITTVGVLALPAFIRTLLVVCRRKMLGKTVSTKSKVGLYLGSFSVTLVVTGVTVFASAATFFLPVRRYNRLGKHHPS